MTLFSVNLSYLTVDAMWSAFSEILYSASDYLFPLLHVNAVIAVSQKVS